MLPTLAGVEPTEPPRPAKTECACGSENIANKNEKNTSENRSAACPFLIK